MIEKRLVVTKRIPITFSFQRSHERWNTWQTFTVALDDSGIGGSSFDLEGSAKPAGRLTGSWRVTQSSDFVELSAQFPLSKFEYSTNIFVTSSVIQLKLLFRSSALRIGTLGFTIGSHPADHWMPSTEITGSSNAGRPWPISDLETILLKEPRTLPSVEPADESSKFLHAGQYSQPTELDEEPEATPRKKLKVEGEGEVLNMWMYIS